MVSAIQNNMLNSNSVIPQPSSSRRDNVIAFKANDDSSDSFVRERKRPNRLLQSVSGITGFIAGILGGIAITEKYVAPRMQNSNRFTIIGVCMAIQMGLGLIGQVIAEKITEKIT